TRRDLREETLARGGIPAALLDTAGLHEPRDEAEAEAVRRAREALLTADLLLVVLDWSRPLCCEERRLVAEIDPKRLLLVLNKVDLACGLGLDEALRLKQ